MFEPCHTAAQNIAGHGMADPTGMALSGTPRVDSFSLERGTTVPPSTQQYTAAILEVLA